LPAYRTYLLYRAVRAFAANTAFTLNLVYQIRTVGLGPFELVMVGTVLEVTCLVAQVPTGVIADLYSRRLSVVVGCLLTGAGTLVEGLVPAYLAVLAASVVWGVGATCIDGAEEAWVADELGEDRAGAAFTRGSQVGRAAAVLGIGASVALAGVRLNLPLLIGGALWLLLGAGLPLVMPEHNFRPAPGARRGTLPAVRAQAVAGARAVRGRWVLVQLLGATLLIGMSSEGLDRLGQAHFLADLPFPSPGTPLVWLGALGVAAMLGSIALTQAVRHRTDALRPAGAGRTLVAFQAAATVAIVVFALAGSFWLAAAAYLLVDMLRAASDPLMSTWLVSQTEPATRATVFSIAGQANAAGEIAGGLPIGYVGSRVSIRAALVAVSLFLVPAVGLLYRAAGRLGPAAPAAGSATVTAAVHRAGGCPQAGNSGG
jgi:DHA3 family tetracycline resistance protein-like MFS transporter